MVRPSASLHPAVGARPLIESATVLLLRDGQQGLEVLISLRAAASSFVPGMYVFPGGRVDADDAAWLDVWQPLIPAAARPVLQPGQVLPCAHPAAAPAPKTASHLVWPQSNS